MDEEKFMISFIATIIGVLPILFLSLIACGKKKSERKTLSSKQKPTSSRRKRSTSSRKAPTSKSNKCAECERFDTQVDAALKSRFFGVDASTDGRCAYINGYVTTSKTCQHGNKNEIDIDRPGFRMKASYVGDGNTKTIKIEEIRIS